MEVTYLEYDGYRYANSSKCSYNLPVVTSGQGYYKMQDSWYTLTKKGANDFKKQFQFTMVDKNTIKVFCLSLLILQNPGKKEMYGLWSFL